MSDNVIDLDLPRGESTLSDEEKVRLAENNHMWLNAFACVHPSDEFCRDVGRDIINRLNHSPIHGDLLGVKIGKVLYVRLNKS